MKYQIKYSPSYSMLVVNLDKGEQITGEAGAMRALFSGEGLVTRITGPGEVYIQTKNLSEFADWIWALIEPSLQMSHAR